jgi:cytochrome b pre-mRNA-processing protein 3
VENRVLSWFSSEAQARRTALKLYGAVVAQARQPGFFAVLGVSDTPEGRTDMIILHLFIVLERLNAAGAEGRKTARALSEIFVTDIDDCLREMGVGDLSVPKKVKRAAQAMGERCQAYQRAATSAPDESLLAPEIASTVSGLGADPASAAALARYVLTGRSHVAAMSDSVLLAGEVGFPPLQTMEQKP